MKAINREIRSWHIQLKNYKSLKDLSNVFNTKLRGWFVCYGRFYPSELRRIWRNIDGYLVRWVRRKYRRFSGHKRRAWQYLRELAQANPKLFVHKQLGFMIVTGISASMHVMIDINRKRR